MTPELRRLLSDKARSLQLRLNHGRVDPITAATEAFRLFTDAQAEGADWLMIDPSTGSTVVLEIGGTDEQDLEALLARKIEQARRSPFSERGRPAACVVRFLEPMAKLWVDDGSR